jgi:hypothetical protein
MPPYDLQFELGMFAIIDTGFAADASFGADVQGHGLHANSIAMLAQRLLEARKVVQ